MAGVTAKKASAATSVSAIKSRTYIHIPRDLGERVADAVATGMGSWTFIISQSIFVGLWIILNLMAVFGHWDPYPFILLNLLFSTQAAYAAPVIMMSQNRQAAKDRMRDDHEAEEVDLLYQINQNQMEILTLLRNQLCGPEGGKGAQALARAESLASLPARKPTPSTQQQPRRRR